MTSYLLSTLPALFVAKLWRRPFVLDYADGRVAEHPASSRIAMPTMRMATVIVGASPHIRVVMAEHGLKARVIPTAVNRAIRYRARRNLLPRLMTNRLLAALQSPLHLSRLRARAAEVSRRRTGSGQRGFSAPFAGKTGARYGTAQLPV
jgi:hypothetical protein